MTNVRNVANDWVEYDDRKRKMGAPILNFDPHAGWEVNYLADKLQMHYPELDREAIKIAVYTYSRYASPPYYRDSMIKWILKRLQVPV